MPAHGSLRSDDLHLTDVYDSFLQSKPLSSDLLRNFKVIVKPFCIILYNRIYICHRVQGTFEVTIKPFLIHFLSSNMGWGVPAVTGGSGGKPNFDPKSVQNCFLFDFHYMCLTF